MGDEVLRIGILGAARIAPKAIIEPAREQAGVEIVAIGASTREKAQAFASEHAIPTAMTRAEVIAHPGIDLIYNALPISEHASASIAALEAGKHVLCEKPFAMSAAETRAMQAAAATHGRRIIEATHSRYHPLWALAKEAVAEIGALQSIDARFEVPVRETADEIRRSPTLGGGCLRDIGHYPLWLIRFLGGEPTVRGASARFIAPGVDESLEAQLDLLGGATATLSCSMHVDVKPQATARIVGSDGVVEIANFVGPQWGALLKVMSRGQERQIDVPRRATFAYQLEAVVDALATGATLPTEGAPVLAHLIAMDALYAAALKTAA
jgi:predicted dehydrogenase